MIFKVLSKDKVKVFVERCETDVIDDIKRFSIGDIVSESVVEFLSVVREQTGIDFSKSKIIIEVVGCSLQSYYIIITRVVSDEKTFDDNEVDMYIFKVSEAEKLFNVIDIIKSRSIEIVKNELYEFKDCVYFCLYVKSNNFNAVDELIPQVEKYLERCRWNIVNDSILKEWGKLLSDNLIKEITATE